MLSLKLVFENFNNSQSEEDSMNLLSSAVLTILQAQKVPILSVGVLVHESCLQGEGDRYIGYLQNEQASTWFGLPEHLENTGSMRFTVPCSHFGLLKVF